MKLLVAIFIALSAISFNAQAEDTQTVPIDECVSVTEKWTALGKENRGACFKKQPNRVSTKFEITNRCDTKLNVIIHYSTDRGKTKKSSIYNIKAGKSRKSDHMCGLIDYRLEAEPSN